MSDETSVTLDETSAASGREAIVRAVYGVVLADGFGQLRARQIADLAGVSPGLIHHYWPNLDALVVEAFELFATEAAAMTRASVNPRDDPHRQLTDLVAALIPDGDAPEVSLWLEAACQARRQPALVDAVQASDDDLVHLVRDIIAQGNQLDRWQVDDPLAAARRVGAIVDGFAFHGLVLESMSPADARAATEHALEALLQPADDARWTRDR